MRCSCCSRSISLRWTRRSASIFVPPRGCVPSAGLRTRASRSTICPSRSAPPRMKRRPPRPFTAPAMRGSPPIPGTRPPIPGTRPPIPPRPSIPPRPPIPGRPSTAIPRTTGTAIPRPPTARRRRASARTISGKTMCSRRSRRRTPMSAAARSCSATIPQRTIRKISSLTAIPASIPIRAVRA